MQSKFFLIIHHSISNLSRTLNYDSTRRLPRLLTSLIAPRHLTAQHCTELTAIKRQGPAAHVWQALQVTILPHRNCQAVHIHYMYMYCIFFQSNIHHLITWIFDNIGILGDSNVICRAISSNAALSGALNTTCTSGSDCFYGQCTNGVCTPPKLQCPTSKLGSVCSGHGACNYTDPSGSTLPSCNILHSKCSTFCICDKGFGGKDCSLNTAKFESRSALR